MPASDDMSCHTASGVPSTVPSLVDTDATDLARLSIDTAGTNETTLSDFYAAVATTPPSLEDWAAHPYHVTDSSSDNTLRSNEPSDRLPSQERLDDARRVPVYDGDGNAIAFRNLYSNPQYAGQRQLVVLIRHFYCHVSICSTWSVPRRRTLCTQETMLTTVPTRTGMPIFHQRSKSFPLRQHQHHKHKHHSHRLRSSFLHQAIYRTYRLSFPNIHGSISCSPQNPQMRSIRRSQLGFS